MNKKIITAVVCAQLLITPTVHAWELPANIDSRKISIAAGITAVLLTLVGITCYAYKKRGWSAAPRLDQESIEDVMFQDLAKKQQEEENERKKLESELRNKLAFISAQLAQKEKTDSENEKIIRALQDDGERQKKQMQTFTLMTGEWSRRLGEAENALRYLRLRNGVADKQSVQETPDKIAMQVLQQSAALVNGLQEHGLLEKLRSPSPRPTGRVRAQSKADREREQAQAAAVSVQATIPVESVSQPVLSESALLQVAHCVSNPGVQLHVQEPKPGQDFGSLSPNSKAHYGAPTPSVPSVLASVPEESAAATDIAGADFTGSLLRAEGEKLEAASATVVSVKALEKTTLDATL